MEMWSISSGDVTKIEVMLEEAPDDTVLVGSIPSELDAGIELNSTYPGGKLGERTPKTFSIKFRLIFIR